MRTHVTIIQEVGVPKIASIADVAANTVWAWKRGKRIPAEYWRSLVAADLATYDELAAGVEAKRRAGSTGAGEAAA